MGKNVEQIAPRIFLYRYGRKVKNGNLKCKNLGIFLHFEIQTSICFKNFKTPLNHAFSDMRYDAPPMILQFSKFLPSVSRYPKIAL